MFFSNDTEEEDEERKLPPLLFRLPLFVSSHKSLASGIFFPLLFSFFSFFSVTGKERERENEYQSFCPEMASESSFFIFKNFFCSEFCSTSMSASDAALLFFLSLFSLSLHTLLFNTLVLFLFTLVSFPLFLFLGKKWVCHLYLCTKAVKRLVLNNGNWKWHYASREETRRDNSRETTIYLK